jgi:predicted ATPase
LRDVTLGKLWNQQGTGALTPLSAVIGKNGAGKSTLFDSFGFLADCLKFGVEEACDANQRGGFLRLRSQNITEPIRFEVYYRESRNSRPITYELSIDLDNKGRPFVLSERLRQRRQGQSRGWPFSFLLLSDGQGIAWKGDSALNQVDESEYEDNLFGLIDSMRTEESSETEIIELNKRKLGIVTLGALKQHPRITAFRNFIEGWYLSFSSGGSDIWGMSLVLHVRPTKGRCLRLTFGCSSHQ